MYQGSDGSGMDPNQMSQQQLQNVNYNTNNGMDPQPNRLPHHAHANKNPKKKAYVRIVEQPAGKALRFRYECEGRSAGSIPGVNSTTDNKTYPTIEIVGYKGRAVVVVSCVTKDEPYRPHPHNLVGKDGCKKGVCTVEINTEPMRAIFSNLGIQCVKKKDIDLALKAREDIRVDPYKTGFSHRFQPSGIDLNAVRLCFQVFLENEATGRFTVPLQPIVSDPIFDKKAMSDLVISRLCSCSVSVAGQKDLILLCEKVCKDDISIRFFEEKDGKVWEALGEFHNSDVHKQTAIVFKAPRYHTLDITEPAKVWIQLRRPSDGVTSEPLAFEYIPLDSGRHKFWNLHRNLKRKPELDIFQQILAVSEEKRQALEPAAEIIDLNTPTLEQNPSIVDEEQEHEHILSAAAVSSSEQQSMASTVVDAFTAPSDFIADDEAEKRQQEKEIDTIIDEKVKELEKQASLTQGSGTLNENAEFNEEMRQLSTTDKIDEWMKSSEFAQPINNDETIDSAENSTLLQANDEDKTLNELLEQVAELDEIYTDHVINRGNYDNTQNQQISIMNEMNSMENCVPPEALGSTEIDAVLKRASMEVQESFDDAATYSSLQIAFKNPIPMSDLMPPTPPASHVTVEDLQHYDPVEVTNINNEQKSPEPVLTTVPNVNKLSSPYMHITAAEQEKAPPLPPKRLRKQDSNAENRSIEANVEHEKTSARPLTQIIIMKTPDQSPPTKRLPAKPGSNNTLPRPKKQGFFSKLFSRGKSKSDLSQASGGGNSTVSSKHGSKATSPSGSREPSIVHFRMNDPNRSSVRSAKSLQPTSLPTSPVKQQDRNQKADGPLKTGKPVGRSVSSVSGKRPSHLQADVIHIPLKGESTHSLAHNEAYSNSSTITLGALDRRTASALQLADIPISDGNMELVAIADRQSLRNLCEGVFNVKLDPEVDLTEAEHFALYTSIPPQATASEFDETSAYYAAVDAGEILTPDEIGKRLAAANGSK